MSKRSEIDLYDSLYADSSVALGIAHGSRVALEHPSECNQKTIAAALSYVEIALERMVENIHRLDALRLLRRRDPQCKNESAQVD